MKLKASLRLKTNTRNMMAFITSKLYKEALATRKPAIRGDCKAVLA